MCLCVNFFATVYAVLLHDSLCMNVWLANFAVGQTGQNGPAVQNLSANCGESGNHGFITDEAAVPEPEEKVKEDQEVKLENQVTLVIQDDYGNQNGAKEDSNEEAVIPQETDRPCTPQETDKCSPQDMDRCNPQEKEKCSQEKQNPSSPQEKGPPQNGNPGNGVKVFSSLSMPYVFPNRTCKECMALRRKFCFL